MGNGHVFFKRQPKCMDVGLEPGVFIINPSPNHLTPAPLAAQGQYFKRYLIMLYHHSAANSIKHCQMSVSKLYDKAKHFKIKA